MRSDELEVSVSTVRRRLFEARLQAMNPSDHGRYLALSDAEKEAAIRASWGRVIPPTDRKMMESVAPLVDKAFAKIADQAFLDQMRGELLPQMHAKMHNTVEYYILMTKYGNDVSVRSPEEETRLMLNYYLMLVEGVFTTQVNILALLLVKGGARYEGTCRPGTSEMEMVTEDSLSNKLRFLQSQGMEFIADACDRQLRNSIAHVEFVAFTNGALAYSVNKDRPKIISRPELEARVLELRKISEAMSDAMVRAFETPSVPAKVRPKKEASSKTVTDKHPKAKSKR